MKRPIYSILFSIVLLAACVHAAPKQPPPSGLSKIGFAIQMGAFADVKNAERFTATLQKKGIEAFYFRKDSGVYAVRFGDFATKEKARTAAKKLVDERLIDTFYIAPPNEIAFAKPQGTSWQKPKPEQMTAPPEPKKPVPPEKPQPKTATGDRDMGAIAARTAERFVGIPYRWGGETVVDGMDCSGFARAVYNLCGLNIPRTSRDQFKAGDPVAKDDLRDGDLVFFGASETAINHVGIYVGNGKFVHAPRRGEEIKVSSVEESYFERRFVGARRYFQ